MKDLIKVLGIDKPLKANDEQLFLQALTHKSYLLDHPEYNLEYDRLEFLGDAILKFVINEYLFINFPKYNSGELTKLSGYVLSDKMLFKIASDLRLRKFVLCGSRIKAESVMSDVMESLIGATYLVYGFEEAKKLILRSYEDIILEADSSELKENYKAALQELTQSKQLGLPEYFVVKSEGPPHNPNFGIEIRLSDGTILGEGEGSSKKEAGQAAALASLDYLQNTYFKEKAINEKDENSDLPKDNSGTEELSEKVNP
jgi:ribonuclease-3